MRGSAEGTETPAAPAQPAGIEPDVLGPDVLGPGGTLAGTIPHYEDRPAQRAMADAVARALAEERVLIAEAGTGTGKTLAYLVPALASGKRVVVSTGTRTLQEQIARQDVPLLAQLLPRPFTAVTLKGVSNYVCRRRFEEAWRTGVTGEDAGAFDAVAAWLDDTDTGDRAELEVLRDDAPIWARITTTPDARLGRRCPHYERCFVTRARRRADRADLILVNHHLFFADLSLRRLHANARVLPDYDAVVFDEAHQLEDVITEHFGVRISTARLGQLIRDARSALGATRGDLLAAGNRAGEAIGRLERAAQQLLGETSRLLRPRLGDSERVEVGPDLFAAEGMQEAWFGLDNTLDALAHLAGDAAERADDERSQVLAGLARRTEAVRDDLAVIAEQSASRYVYWGEVSRAGVALCAAPVSVADIVRREILRGIGATVLTSATLSAAGSFRYVRERLGLARPGADPHGGDLDTGRDADREIDELRLESPFDYGRQALLYVPRDLPDPRADGYFAAALARIVELLAISEGRAFVLFTSHRALRAAAAQLPARSQHPLLVQGQEPRATLLERFRATPGAVLLATGSFWEGVDVPGEALSMVIIDKLPFAPPVDPLTAARMRRIEQSGGDPFWDYQLPQAALSLKQGAGRLIRSQTDRGIIAVLDPRLVARAYGRVFLQTLPPALRRTSALEQVRRWWTS